MRLGVGGLLSLQNMELVVDGPVEPGSQWAAADDLFLGGGGVAFEVEA